MSPNIQQPLTSNHKPSISNYFRLYYKLRPFIHRRFQILLRRQYIKYKRKDCLNEWPILEGSEKPPEFWRGWPGGKKFTLVLQHDVENGAGLRNIPELTRMEMELGFRSSFSFVAERYSTSESLREELKSKGFGISVHGLKHDGKLFWNKKIFSDRAKKINNYLQKWGTKGFTSPSMHRNLNWMHELNIDYSTSTFDTDPFEPQPEGVKTIFPFWVENLARKNGNKRRGFVELPYTLPQDSTLFILMQEKSNDIWKKKLDWIAEKGGLALLNTHPDYMDFKNGKIGIASYPVRLYFDFLEYISRRYHGQYWNVLPDRLAAIWKDQKDFTIYSG